MKIINKRISTFYYTSLILLAALFNVPKTAATTDQTELIELNYKIKKSQGVISTEAPVNVPSINFDFNPIKPGRCGAFDLDTTTFSSFDDGSFKRMQSQVIGMLKDNFNPVGLIGTVIKSANPDLYETIMNGVFSAETNFNGSIGQCEDIQQASADLLLGDLQGVSSNEALSEEISSAEADPASVDVTKVMKQVGNGEKGIEISDGVYKGGEGQAPIMIVKDTAITGYNTLAGRSLNDTTPANLSEYNPITTTFSSPKALTDYALEVVGETEMRTSTGTKTERAPGKGVKNQARIHANELYIEFVKVMSKPLSQISKTDLSLVSAGNTLQVNLDLIRMLKAFPTERRKHYINALSTKIAFAKEVDKLLLLRRALVAGIEVTRLKSFKASVEEHNTKIKNIDDELNMIEQELRLREMVAGNTIENIYQAYALLNEKYTPVGK
ncbi:hypothetical protein [uncultured Shewanella sp.]|uniref:hypothetical protein n=1 Tax=uncultured Shewanella sp. TaxID=173975 RepID=UPI0026083E90|nr:hypothetical protein [uncultured Shewanella sp.]